MNPAPSRRERRSSSAIRPSICTSARSMMCSSSPALSAPAPLKASKWPHASGANRPRSCGPNTRNVIVVSFMDARTGLKARRGGPAIPAASILSLSNQDIPTVQPPALSILAVDPWVGFGRRLRNVPLRDRRSKLRHFIYNLLQGKEFRIYHVVCRLICVRSRRQQTLELAERIGPLKQRSGCLPRAQSLERDLRAHFKVYEPARGADDRHDVGIGDPPAARRHDHVSDHRQLFGQLPLFRAKIGLAL